VAHLEYAETLAAARPEQLLETLLSEVLGRPGTPLRELRAVSTAELDRITRLQGPQVRHEIGTCLATAWERAAARHPDRPALTDDRGTLTYSEVDRRANRLAQVIQQRVGSDHVGVALPPDRDLVLTVLAAGKAGRPTSPSTRPALRCGPNGSSGPSTTSP
jgi:non-ribosomal peptide synthetase component F